MRGQYRLTFDAVDDLVAAHARSKLARAQAGTAFAPSSVGPLIELSFEASTGRYGPLLESRWLDFGYASRLALGASGRRKRLARRDTAPRLPANGLRSVASQGRCRGH